MSLKKDGGRNNFWKWRKSGQKHSTADSSPVVLWFTPLHHNFSIKLGMHINDTMVKHSFIFGCMSMKTSWARNNFWKWRNHGQKDSTADSHLSYCDSPPCQHLSMNFVMHANSTMVQYFSIFGGMSMKTDRGRNYFWM
jgi:hypothetical protein